MNETLSMPIFVCAFCDGVVNQFKGYCAECNDYKGVMLMSDFISEFMEG